MFTSRRRYSKYPLIPLDDSLSLPPTTPLPAMKPMQPQATINRLNMYKAKGIRDKKGKLVGGAYMMKNRSGDQAITAETGGFSCVLPRVPRPRQNRGSV